MTGSRAIRLLDEAMDFPITWSTWRNLVKAPNLVRSQVGNQHFVAVLKGHVRMRDRRGESDWLGRSEVEGIGRGRGNLSRTRIVLDCNE